MDEPSAAEYCDAAGLATALGGATPANTGELHVPFHRRAHLRPTRLLLVRVDVFAAVRLRLQPQTRAAAPPHSPELETLDAPACALHRESIFNQTMATRPHNKTVVWARNAEFAVGAATVLATPRWVYELLLKLVVSEGWCYGGSIHWSHSLERMWLEILDPRVPKMKTWLSARQPLGRWQKCIATALDA